MKKIVVSILAGLAFSVAAFAQTGTETNQGSTASPSMNQSGQQQPGYSQPDPAAQSGSTAGQTNNPGTASAEKKLRGCVQSAGGQYMLETKKGKVALTGQDVSAYVGHEVAVKGTWEGGAAGTGVSAGDASAAKSFNVSSVDMISDTCSSKSSKGNSGSMGTTPSTTPSGTGSPTNPPQQ